MAQHVHIAPSILSADQAALGRDLERVSGADFIHIDVMDGHFTPNLTFGAETVRACKRSTSVPLDVHMMVTNPDESADWYIDAGADIVSVHVEAAGHLHRLVKHIQDRGAKAGVVLNPATPVCMLENIIDDVDLVLVMSVDPGFGGQAYIEGTYAKLRELRALCERHGVSPLVEVDGGVTTANIECIVAAGADVLVAGSAVFGAADPAQAVSDLRQAGERGLTQREA